MAATANHRPRQERKTASAASVFKHSTKKIGRAKDGQRVKDMSSEEGETTLIAPSNSVKSIASSRKAVGRVTKKKRTNEHPLAVEFKETSKNYRQHLFQTASMKINKTLESLLGRLYDSILHIASPGKPSPESGSSPLKLTAPAKYERMALKIYQPLSLYRLKYSATDETGKHIAWEATLDERMLKYSQHLANRAKRIKKLQQEWETVVGEIWKLGVTCLGEDTMEELLITQKPPSSSNASPSPSEPTLFVPEHGDSSPTLRRKHNGTKKRVSFDAPEDYKPTPLTEFPTFIYQPSQLKNKDVPTAPRVATEDVNALRSQIRDLGKEQVVEMHNIAKDHTKYWKRKNALLAQVLRSE